MDGTYHHRATEPALRAPGGFVYWALLLMGFAAFAPAILIPEWRAYEALMVREQMERQRLERLESAVDRERRMMEGLRGDPAVIARVAQRELGFRHADDQWIAVQPADPTGGVLLVAKNDVITNPEAPLEDEEYLNLPEGIASIPRAASLPPMIDSFMGLLPPLPYDFLFAREPTRSIMMCLGMAAIGAGVLLFGRRPYVAPDA